MAKGKIKKCVICQIRLYKEENEKCQCCMELLKMSENEKDLINQETNQSLNIKDQTVQSDTPLKELLINYVGNKLNPENDEITIDMILRTLAEEFPETIIALAEENFIAGYKQALTDTNDFKIVEDIKKPNESELEINDEPKNT